MAGLHDMAKMSVSGTPGTGTVTLGSAVSGYQTFAAAGVADGEVVSYSILDSTNWEVGRGTYSASGATLTRGPLFSNNVNAAINASSSAVVWIAPLAEDFKIAALQDAGVSNVVDGQILAYVAAASKWVNVSPPNGAPAGRLTLASATPILNSDVSGASMIYYTPYTGNGVQVPVSAGVFKYATFSELSLALDSTTTDSGYQAVGNLYDIFLYNNSGTLVIGTGPAWSSSTSRGTGAGTTQIQMINGLWVNANAITLRLGTGSSNTVSIAAQMAIYLGTMYATANGQTAMQFAPGGVYGGTNNVLGLYNAHNRVRFISRENDSNGWTYNSSTWRASDNSNSNRVTWVDGLGQSQVKATVMQVIGSASADGRLGVTFDALSPPIFSGSANGATYQTVVVSDRLQATGLRFAQSMEAAYSGTPSFYGGGNQELTVELDM